MKIQYKHYRKIGRITENEEQKAEQEKQFKKQEIEQE